MTAAGGGRRDGENSGRCRVMDNDLSGIAHNGFPVSTGAAGLSAVGTPGVRLAIGGLIVVSIAPRSTGSVAASAQAWE